MCLAGGGIEDVRDEHEAVGQPHAQIMYAASGVDKELHEQGRLRPGEVTTRVVGWEDAPRAYLEPAIKLIVRRA